MSLDGLYYGFYVSWVDDCTEEQVHPFAESQDLCENRFKAAYVNCGNDGAGGYHTEGCVRYGFQLWCDGSSSSAAQTPSSTLTPTPTPTPTPAPSPSPPDSSTAPPQPTEGPMQCYGMRDCNAVVDKDFMELSAGNLCSSSGLMGQKLTPNNPSTKYTSLLNGMEYVFFAEWESGCITEQEHNFGNTQDQCAEAFKAPYYNCVSNGGNGGYYTIGCVRYGFQPTCAPPSEPYEGPLTCNIEWKCHADVHGDVLGSAARKYCSLVHDIPGDVDKGIMNAQSIDRHFTEITEKIDYNLYANWTAGCTEETSHDIAPDVDTCVNRFTSPYWNCTNNLGGGGWHQEGCVKYSFEPVCS